MATWVRSGTGTAPSSTDAALSGRYSLTNGTAPADFDPAGVTSVQIQYTITGASFVDDTWDNLRAATLDDGTNTAATINGTDATGLGNTGSTTNETDSSPNTGLSTANWEAMAVSGGTTINGAYTSWTATMKADAATQTMSALTVTITYTPASTDRQARVSFAEMEVPNAPRQARVSFAELEVPDAMPDFVRGWARGIEAVSPSTITINKPTGTVENDIMYAYIVHESAAMTSDTPPSGWADVGTNPHAFGGGNSYVYKKTAGASEGSSYVFTFDPANQMVGYIITVKNTYTEDALSIALVDDTDDGTGDSTFTETLTTSTSATGVLAIFGHDAPVGSSDYFNSTTGMTKRDETGDAYGPGAAIAAWFTETISGQSSITETFTYDDATTGYDFPVLLVSFTPATTDRQARVSFAELEVPTAPRQARVSFAELEVPTAPRQARVSWAEMEVPTAPRKAQVSWAELELPDAPREAQVSWAELEVPDAPRQARISWAELEIPNADRKSQVSWAELEVPNAPTADREARVSWAEMEIPNGARKAQVSFAEMEVPDAPRRAQVSWAELETGDGPRRAYVSWAEFEIPTAPRKAQVSWAELEVPPGARRGQVSFAELEVPTAPRRAQVSWAEMEAPQFARRALVAWAVLETPSPVTVYTKTRGLSKFIWKG